jgi:hypothetical protein
MTKIGKASYNKGFTKKNWFKMEDGDNVYRILPPLFEFADRGKWSEFYKVEYGYTNSQDQFKPFLCNRVVNKKTKMVEVECPACLYREKMQAEIGQLKDAVAQKKITEAKFKAEVAKRRAFNLDSKHYVNAIDLEGKIGLLKIPYKAKQQLDVLIDKLRDEGVDPLSVETGRFFVFTRSGFALDTQYQVSVYTEKVKTDEYGIVNKEVNHELTEAIINRLEHEAFDLSLIFKSISNEDMQDIVDNGSEAVDRVFGAPATKNTEVVEEEEPIEEEFIPQPPKAVAKAIVNTTKSAAPTSGLTNPLVKTIDSKPVNQKVAPKKAEVSQSDEDFLASLGVN